MDEPRLNPMIQQVPQPQQKKRMFWPLFTTAIFSALVGVLIACLVLPIVIMGQMDDRLAAAQTPAPLPANDAPPLNITYDNPVPAVSAECGGSVVYIEVATTSPFQGMQVSGSGSGVILSSDGYIVTNRHVIQEADHIYVSLGEEDRVEAELIGADAGNDLAVLKINRTGLKPASIGTSGDLVVGDMLIAIGNPFGERIGVSTTVGYVSALNRKITMDGVTLTLIQTDAAINPGNSGGGMFNSKGQLVGINTLKTRISGQDEFGGAISAEGIGFAIPIDVARPVIDQLIAHGEVPRPGIGVIIQTLSQERAEILELTPGVLIVELVKEGPAAKAGLLVNDVIVQADGKEVKANEDFIAVMSEKQVGDSIALRVVRNGEERDVTVEIGNTNRMVYE